MLYWAIKENLLLETGKNGDRLMCGFQKIGDFLMSFFFFPVLVSTERTLKRKYRAPKFLNGYQCNNSILVPNGDNYSVEETFDKVMRCV